MARAELNEGAIAAHAYAGKGDSIDYLWDATSPGLALRTYPTGQKRFVARLPTERGGAKVQILGAWPELSLEAARRQAARLRAAVELGRRGLPQRIAISEKRVHDLAAEHVTYARSHRKLRTSADIERLYRSKILPTFAARPLVALTPYDVELWHRGMKSTPVEANRAAAVLKAGWNLAEMWGWVAPYTNPLRYLGRFRFPETPRARVLSDDELERFLARLAELEAAPETTRAAIAERLLLIEGMRRSEVERLRWNELSLEGPAPALHLGDSKTGAKTIYLSDKGAELLRRVPRVTVPYVFGGINLRGFHERLRAEIGAPDLTRHDLRRTLATRLDAANVPAKAIAEKLGQKTVRVTESHYIHAGAERRREIANVGARLVSRTGVG